MSKALSFVVAFSLSMFALSSFAFSSSARTEAGSVREPSIPYYQSRYPLKNVYDKLVDNQGNGFTPLYGVRNFRAVLSGVVYRGGANNVYNIHQKRPNMNPLPNEGLDHLCQEGFGTAIYLYSTNFNTAPKVTRCQSIFGDANEVDYQSENVLSNSTDLRAVLKVVYDRLTSSRDQRPIYIHCWNGWHSSGFTSAAILRQFCGFSGDDAVKYWNKNTDGNNGSSYEPIRKKIRAFQPYAEFAISSELKKQVCPSSL